MKGPKHRLPLLTLYFLFHQFLPPEFHRPQWPGFFEKYASDFDDPSVEAIAAHLATQQEPEWTPAQVDGLHRSYFRDRHKSTPIELGRLFEAAFTLYLAELSRTNGDENRARDLIAFAVECYPNHEVLRRFEGSLEINRLGPIDWKAILLPPAAPPSAGTSAGE